MDPNYVKVERNLTQEKLKEQQKDEKKTRQNSGRGEKSAVTQVNSIVQPYVLNFKIRKIIKTLYF